MKKIFLTTVFLATISYALFAQEGDILIRINSSIEREPFTTGYVNASGDTIIPIGKYNYCHSKEFDKMAIVSLKGQGGIYGIDRNEKVLFKVVIYDNGPDYVKNGLFRIERNGKIGYANMDGEIVIIPKYDAASPFFDGYAAVCFGGKKEKVHEMTMHKGGKWGIIDTSGKIVEKPIYERIKGLKNGKAKVQVNGEWTEITIK